MACILPFKESKDNTKSLLVSVGAIDDSMNILDHDILKEWLDQIRLDIKQAYNVEGTPIIVDPSSGNKVMFNDSIVNDIDRVRKQQGIFDSQETGNVSTDENIYFQLETEQVLPKTITSELRDRLVEFTLKLNPDFKIEVLDALIKNKGVAGIAKIKDFKIQLQNGRESALPEEVAHFFVELLPENHELKKRMYDEAPRTRLYKQVYNQYKEIYGNDIQRIKRETMAKLIALYLTDKQLFNYYSGSDSLVQNLIRWIKDLFKWLKGSKKLNSFIESANKILDLDVSDLAIEQAHILQEMYALEEFIENTQILESLGNYRINNYNRLVVNISDTVLDYRNYPGTKKEKRAFLFDERQSDKRDEFYLTAKLTALGRELADKAKFLNKEIVFYTQMAITPALRQRLEQEFGPNIKIERVNVESIITDENGTVIKEETLNSLQEFLNNQEGKPLIIDNSQIVTSKDFRRYNNIKGFYEPIEDKIARKQRQKEKAEYNEKFLNELKQFDRDKLIRQVQNAFETIKREVKDINRVESIMKDLGDEEVSQLFRDKDGNLLLPLQPSEQAVRFIQEMNNLEAGLLKFLGTLEAMTVFFQERNESNYENIRTLLEGSDQDIENALQELFYLTKIGNSWKEYTEQLRDLAKEYPNTKLVQQILSDLEGQIDRTKRIARELSKDGLSKRLSNEFAAFNTNIDGQIQAFEEKISKLEPNDPLVERIQKSINRLKKTKKEPKDLIDIFNGDIKDMNAITVWVKTLHQSSDPLIGSISKILQRAFVEVETQTIQRAQRMGSDVGKIQKEHSISQKDIEDNLIITESFWTEEPDPSSDGKKWVKKERLALLNQWQNLHLRQERMIPMLDAKRKWAETKSQEDLKEFRKQSKLFRQWETENFNRPYKPEYYKRYEELTQTEEDEQLFEEVRELQFAIYNDIEDTSLKLQVETDLNAIKELNKEIEDKRRELKELKRPNYTDGSSKTGKDLAIAKMLQRKSEIDREFYEYSSDFAKFKNDFRVFINTLNLSDEVYQNLLLKSEGENFSELYTYAKQHSYEVLQWLDASTIVRYAQEWYEERQKITDELSDLSNRLAKIYEQDQTDLKQIWEDLLVLTSPLRDEDNILDGSVATPQIQSKVLEFERQIEYIKELTRTEREGIYSPEIKALKKEISRLISELNEIQSKTTTDAYNDTFVELAQDTGFLDAFYSVHPNIQIDYNTNLSLVVNSLEFQQFIESNQEHPFVQWYENNHLEKIVYIEGEKTTKIVPTYIWYKIEPSNQSYILTLPSFKYSKRKVKDEFKTEKVDWDTWNPITKEWLPLKNKTEFFNPAYNRLRQGNSKERALFQILKLVTDFHLQTQNNTIVKEGRIGFALPYVRKMDLDNNYLKSMWANFTDTRNTFEQGEANFDESENSTEEKTMKNRLISWFNGFIGEEDVEQETKETRKFQRIAVPYVHHIESELVSRDILYTTTMFAGSTNKADRMLKALPTFSLLEEVLDNTPKLDEKGKLKKTNTNRLKALQFSKDYHLYGVNKKYELGQEGVGRTIDTTLRYIRKANTFGSLGWGFANVLKNNLQGRLQNMIGARFVNWSSPKSMRKAAGNLKINFISYISEAEKPIEKRSLDYQIITYMNPELGEDVYQHLFKGAAKRVAKDKHIYMFNKAMEYSIAVNLLYGHLYHVKVEKDGQQKTLYDILKFDGEKLTTEEGWKTLQGKEINEEYLLETKLAYKTVAEYMQGKIVDRTALTQTTIGQALLYFKNWLIPMLRRRFDSKRENYMVGEQLEGYWRTWVRLSLIMTRDFLQDGKLYWNSFTPEEQRNYQTALQETLFMAVSLALLSLGFGFDADDPDKFKKLKDNSYAENLALLVVLQAKNETEALSLMPFFNIEKQFVPPVATEGVKWVINPTIGFAIIDNTWKTMNYLYDLGFNPENAYYTRNMPQFNIEKGDPKFLHYLGKVFQIDDLAYNTNPDMKIRAMISMMKR